MEGYDLHVRKGAWTREEDDLLRQCIENHGEGKWHQVPYKAGLRRCRKSCRIRWLNYLKPNIKRGEFMEDEVDLIVRLQKLLGNRWSLIAGRLPGRTANDVKNYWKTRLRTNCPTKKMKDKSHETIKTIVIRPQPRSLTKSSNCLNFKEPILERTQLEENFSTPSQTPTSTRIGPDWCETFSDDKDAIERSTTGSGGLELEELLASFWVDDDMPQSTRTCINFSEEGLSRGDFSFSVDLWNHSNEEQRKST